MTELSTKPRVGVPEVTLVTLPACHFCEDAHEALNRLAVADQVSVRIVDATSEQGSELIARHRPGLFPLALLDGEFLSAGRLPRRLLAARLGLDRGQV